MSVKVSVVCTGQLRDPFEFGIIMTRLLNLKEQGRIDQLILSSWKNDLLAEPEITDVLRKAGFQIVFSDFPVSPGPGYAWVQKRQLAAALYHVEPGSIVAKVRTDKCAHLIERVVSEANLRRETIQDEPEGGTFKRRVSVTNIVTNWLLSHSDFTFVGLREDLLRMAVCDVTDSAWIGAGPVAEVEWYHAALSGADPVVDLWMRHLDAGLLARRLTSLSPASLDREALAVIWPIFARGLSLTMANYRIMLDVPLAGTALPAELPLSLLTGRQDMMPQGGLALVGPKVKIGNAAMARRLFAEPAVLAAASVIPDPAKVGEALQSLLGDAAAAKVRIGHLPVNHLPLQKEEAVPHPAMLRIVFGAAADVIEATFPDPAALNRLARGRDPDNALLAEAIRIGQEGGKAGDQAQMRAAAEVLAMLTMKRHPPALPAFLASPGVTRFIEPDRFLAVLQRAASFEARVWDMVREKSVHDPLFQNFVPTEPKRP